MTAQFRKMVDIPDNGYNRKQHLIFCASQRPTALPMM
jgi:hypothetical protein